MEADNEVKGNGNSYTTLYRQLDTRLGRWLTLDPMMNEFSWISPFASTNNNPIVFIDKKGDIPWPIIAASSKIKSHLNTSRSVNNEKARPHQGLDISSSKGTVVKAAAEGRVIATSGSGNFKDNPTGSAPGAKDGGGWGNYVIIDHGEGLLTIYAHLEQGSMKLEVGNKIENGQPIGKVGSSGHSFGPHLHVEAIFNEDGSKNYAGAQYRKNNDNKNSHVFSLEDVQDLQKIIEGKETAIVKMLDGKDKLIGKYVLNEVTVKPSKQNQSAKLKKDKQ
jgi:murein DD-endopeptidase MepM/ murein hydrolase activator NlpD